jgi:hypothetical protein
MRSLKAASIVFVLVLIGVFQHTPATRANNGERLTGQDIFRFDTFGDEQLWTDVLRMHEVIPAVVDPATALAVGLKVDVQALPAAVIAALKAGQVDLTDPKVTVELLRLNAVVGVKGTVDAAGTLTSVGITCALCHSTVDNSLVPGIGKRLDGWANVDLNPGAILALSPAFENDEELKAELNAWGPGKYDPRHHYFDGTNIVTLNTPSVPVDIPAIYGLNGVGFETYTGDGPISYWNSYVGVGQMGGHGSFEDLRPPIGISITQTPDLVTPKLPALLDYQLGLRTPKPPAGSFNTRAASRGKQLFQGKAMCSTCHKGQTLTDVMSGPPTPFLHDPVEVGQDPTYASRSATGQYRTTPLRGLWQTPPYFHDGSAPDLVSVVNHYDALFKLGLTEAEKADLVEYLKSI